MDTQPAPKKILDANARRGAIIGGIALAVILVLFLIGKTTNLTDLEAVQTVMQDIASSPWALPALILLFVIGAFIGIPQFALLAISVAAFGPWLGALFGWIANMASGAATFYAGRLAGEKTFRRYAGETANKLSGFVGRNAMMTSAIVRNVPAGPALLVNMAFGVSHAKFLHYWAGMGVGIIPKIALIAFAGQSLFAALKGNPLAAIGAAAAAIGVYIAIAAYARARMRKSGQSVALIGQNEVDRAATSDDVTSHVE
ncbi:VTT domain-containing protein [Hyphomonas sp.]|uniref:TVP38/TMEM64 family protein n=1 Tax=Hyphomonas sp. TaxID=87 RepID=UPI0025C34728|nr:VTT domain-containing protein [Hyphomonas sp.]